MPPLLPAKLLFHVIFSSLRPSSRSPSFSNLPARYTLLRAYSLLSRVMTRWAQFEMYRHVLLRGKHIASFQRTSARLEKALGGLYKTVESMRVSDIGSYASKECLGPILGRCGKLKDLRMVRAGVSVQTLGLPPSEHAL